MTRNDIEERAEELAASWQNGNRSTVLDELTDAGTGDDAEYAARCNGLATLAWIMWERDSTTVGELALALMRRASDG